MKVRTHTGAEGLSIFVQGCGYASAATLTFVFGALHEVSSGWTIPLVFLACVLGAAVPAGIVLGQGGVVEDSWERAR